MTNRLVLVLLACVAFSAFVALTNGYSVGDLETAASDHHKGYKKGHDEDHYSDHHSKKGEKGEKGYEGKHG